MTATGAAPETAADPEWVVREGVPVYDAHELIITDPRTGKEVRREKVTKARLQAIADARNAKISRTGDESPIIIGHTRPGVPEWEQPPICGYADRYEVGAHPADGRPTLYARAKFYPTTTVGRGEHKDELTAEEVMRRFPRRSPEIWLDDDDLDAVSLLGPTTPARYLGLLRNSRLDALTRMAKAAEAPVTADPAAPAAPTDYAAETPPMDRSAELIAALQELLAKFAASEEAPPPDLPTEPAQYAAAEACGPRAGMPDDREPELEKVRMQRSQTVREVRDLQAARQRDAAELQRVKTQYARMERKALRAERRTALAATEAAGYRLDVDEELDATTPADITRPALDDDQFDKFHAKVQARYERVAGADGLIRTAEADGGAGPWSKPALHDKAMSHMLKHPGMGYEAALSAVRAGN